MDEPQTRMTDNELDAIVSTCRDVIAHDLPSTAKLIKRAVSELRAGRGRSVEPPPDAISLLRLILPMAKGYAHEHPVGSNQRYVNDAEEFIAAQEEAK